MSGQVYITILLTFMEYLYTNHIKVLTINNYISSLMPSFNRFNLTLTPFENHRSAKFIKPLKINKPLSVKVTPGFSEEVLRSIIKVSKNLECPLVFTALYWLAFFSFLRLFNLVPHGRAHYDPSRHLARADIQFLHHDATVLTKLSKTNQS